MKVRAVGLGASVGIAVAVAGLVVGGIAYADHGRSPAQSPVPVVRVDDPSTLGPSPTEGSDDSGHHGATVTPHATSGPDETTEGPDDNSNLDPAGQDADDDHHGGNGACESADDCRQGANQPED